MTHEKSTFASQSRREEVDPIEIRDVVAAYEPRGFTATPANVRSLTACKALVGAVAWTSVKQARNALTYAFEYAQWADSANVAIAETPMSLGTIDEFIAARLSNRPEGSKVAVRSYLTRIVRAIDGRTSTTSDVALRTHTRSVVIGSAATTAEGINGVIEAVCSATAGESNKRRRADIRLVSSIIEMLESAHRPVRVDVVLSSAVIEEFLASLPSSTPSSSLATYAWALYRLQGLLIPPVARGRARRTPRTPGGRPVPYTDEEVALLLRWARSRRIHDARRYTIALIALVRGAGADGSEAGHVRTHEDVVVEDARVTVRLGGPSRDRSVTVVGHWASVLARAVLDARANGDEYLIGGACADRTKRASNLWASAHSNAPDCDMGRLRDAALVERCVEIRLPDLLDSLGLRTPGGLDRIWEHVVAARTEL